MGFQSTLAWKLLEGRVLMGRPSIWSSSLSHDAKAPNGLIVTRDTSFFKTCCYLMASLESSMSLSWGTRTRPPQTGFVQTGIWQVYVSRWAFPVAHAGPSKSRRDESPCDGKQGPSLAEQSSAPSGSRSRCGTARSTKVGPTGVNVGLLSGNVEARRFGGSEPGSPA